MYILAEKYYSHFSKHKIELVGWKIVWSFMKSRQLVAEHEIKILAVSYHKPKTNPNLTQTIYPLSETILLTTIQCNNSPRLCSVNKCQALRESNHDATWLTGNLSTSRRFFYFLDNHLVYWNALPFNTAHPIEIYRANKTYCFEILNQKSELTIGDETYYAQSPRNFRVW